MEEDPQFRGLLNFQDVPAAVVLKLSFASFASCGAVDVPIHRCFVHAEPSLGRIAHLQIKFQEDSFHKVRETLL